MASFCRLDRSVRDARNDRCGINRKAAQRRPTRQKSTSACSTLAALYTSQEVARDTPAPRCRRRWHSRKPGPWRNSMNDWSAWLSESDPEDLTLPLWRRTQLRIVEMETLFELHANTASGSSARTQELAQQFSLRGRHLVQRLRDWEESRSSSASSPLD